MWRRLWDEERLQIGKPNIAGEASWTKSEHLHARKREALQRATGANWPAFLAAPFVQSYRVYSGNLALVRLEANGSLAR